MGIFDEDQASANEAISRAALVDAVREFGEPGEHEFIAYRQAIQDLAKRHQCAEYDAFANVEDGEIVTLLIQQGISESRAWDILDQCAERWKPGSLIPDTLRSPSGEVI